MFFLNSEFWTLGTESGIKTIIRSCMISGEQVSGNEGHSSVRTPSFFGCVTEFEPWIVDGRAILNDLGINYLPRNLMYEFFITASPRVFGGDILGFGSVPFHGFP
jgi:hypothetical protein